MTRFLSIVTLMLCIASPALAGKTVGEKLEARKKEFSAKADPQKIKDYDDGVRQVAESGVLERAKNVGDLAPDFTLPSAVETQVTLSNLLKDGPVVMTWYRGEWCPYCNIYLQDLQDHAAVFKEAGAQIVAISPEKVDKGMALADRMALDFHVLSDEGSRIAEEYGVVYTLPEKIAGYLQKAFDIRGANNDERNVLPLAVSYVIAQDGTITYAFVDADYRKRAETAVLLEEVKKLSSQKNN